MKAAFTNGCFDVLHQGHRQLLQKAATFGNVLIVAVNDDASVRALKGEGRPFQPLTERMRAIHAWGKTAYLAVTTVPFDGTAEQLEGFIRSFQPEVLVKGDDYTAEEVVGGQLMKQWGGRVVILPRTPHISTTEEARAQGRISGP